MSLATDYTEELALLICARRSEGESLKKICDDEAMPNRATVYRWLANEPKLVVMFNQAVMEHADDEFERLHELVDQEPLRDERGRVDLGWVAQLRLRIEARKWTLARMSPKKYGERTEVTGADGAPLIPLDDPQRLLEGVRRLAFVLARASQAMGPEAGPPLLLTHEPPRRIDLYGLPVDQE